MKDFVFLLGYVSSYNLFPEPLTAEEEAKYLELYENGYVAKHYYLDLDEEKPPCISLDEKEIKSLVEQLKDEYRNQICNIRNK